MAVIGEVRNWRSLAKQLVYAYDQECEESHAFALFTGAFDLDVLLEHGSDEDCLGAVVERFMQGRSCHYPQPSWRAVIWSLYCAKELQLADQIRNYAEPSKGWCIL